MEINIKSMVLLLSTFTMALSAGLFYGWVVSVIPGTKKISDETYVQTMQSINREILNPSFFIVFFGAIIMMIISCYMQYKTQVNDVFYLTLSATLIYLIGTIGITMFGNVPLNNMVEALDLSSFSSEDFSTTRDSFEERWNRFNLIRTIAAIVAFFLLLIAMLKK